MIERNEANEYFHDLDLWIKATMATMNERRAPTIQTIPDRKEIVYQQRRAKISDNNTSERFINFVCRQKYFVFGSEMAVDRASVNETKEMENAHTSHPLEIFSTLIYVVTERLRR